MKQMMNCCFLPTASFSGQSLGGAAPTRQAPRQLCGAHSGEEPSPPAHTSEDTVLEEDPPV